MASTRRVTELSPDELREVSRFEVSKTPKGLDGPRWVVLAFVPGNEKRGYGYDGLGVGMTLEDALAKAVADLERNNVAKGIARR